MEAKALERYSTEYLEANLLEREKAEKLWAEIRYPTFDEYLTWAARRPLNSFDDIDEDNCYTDGWWDTDITGARQVRRELSRRLSRCVDHFSTDYDS